MAEERLSDEEQLRKLQEQMDKVQQKLRRKQAQINQKKRKERTRLLIEIGGLADIAHLTNADRGVLLGAFLEIEKGLTDSAKVETWKQKGDMAMLERKNRTTAAQQAEAAEDE